MICSQCGTNNGDNAKFCVGCGAPLAQNSAPRTTPQQNAGAANQPAQGPYGINYIKGCASQAWEDIRHSGHWASRSFIIGLISLIPIFRWTNTGYFYSLAKHAARGNRDALPGNAVSGDNFKNGFFLWLIGLLIAIILGIIFVPFWVLASVSMPVGWLFILIYAVFTFFSFFFIKLLMTRYIMLGFDDTFKLSKIWKAYKRRFGKLFCLDFLPNLFIGLIQSAFATVFGLLISSIALSSQIIRVYNNGVYYFNYSAANYTQLIVVCVLIGLVGLYLILVCEAVKQMIITRAYGIYVARYVPEWVEESERKQAFVGTEGYVNNTPVVNPAQPADTGLLTEQQYASKPQGAQVTSQAKPAPSTPTPSKAGSDFGTRVLGGGTVVLQGQDGKDYEISTFPAVIGKGSAANVILTGDESISRIHAKVHEYGDKGFVIEDLNSSNKTFLNGNELQPEELVILSDGDTLKMGKSRFTVQIS